MKKEVISNSFVKIADLRTNAKSTRTAVDCNEIKNLRKLIVDNAKPEHSFTNEGVTMDDQIVCACGWKSKPYWDGFEWAFDEWGKHIQEVVEGVA